MLAEFGRGPLTGEVMLPAPGSALTLGLSDIEALVAALCDRFGVHRDLLDVELIDDDDPPAELRDHVPIQSRFAGAAGHYRRNGDRFVIAINQRQRRNPVALVATIAHELGHVRLLGEDRVTTTQRDQEQLTDLSTVFFGLGIFTANAAYEYSQDAHGWQTTHLGYLGEKLFGYALAYYAGLRVEETPAWANQLDTNPASFMRQGLRYLRRRAANT
jgi:hypothetical protein